MGSNRLTTTWKYVGMQMTTITPVGKLARKCRHGVNGDKWTDVITRYISDIFTPFAMCETIAVNDAPQTYTCMGMRVGVWPLQIN